MKTKYITYFYLTILLLPSCSKKADGDEEMRKMIVGTWRANVGGSILRPDRHIMEFTEDGKYISIEYTSSGELESVDTSNADYYELSKNFKADPLIYSIEDSIYYEINDGFVEFYTKKSLWPSWQNMPWNNGIMGINWIKPEKLKSVNKYERVN